MGFLKVAVRTVAVAFCFLAGQATAQATYSFTSAPATPAQTTNHTTCTVGTCSSYPANAVININFTTATNLPAGLVATDISTLVTSFVLTDGITTMASTDPQVSVNTFSVSTNGLGQVTSSRIDIYRWHGAKLAGQPLDNIYTTGGSVAVAYVNAPCISLGKGPAATSMTDNCVGGGSNGGNPNASTIRPSAGSYSSPPLPQPVPTLSEWAMIVFGLILAGGAALYIQRRQFTA